MKLNETIDRQHTICFTGHRPKDLFGYTDKTPYISIINALKPFLSVLYENGYTDYISGGAQGFDQHLATTVMDCSEGKSALNYGQAVIRLLNRNKKMIEASAATIALFEHTKNYEYASGGTSATIRKSLEHHHTVILLDPYTLKYKVIHPT